MDIISQTIIPISDVFTCYGTFPVSVVLHTCK